MPTTYAHDLFGKRVYRRLPGKLKRLIRGNSNLYRIGLHGPDILFYYFISKNPVTRFGVKMHGQKAANFFETGMEQVRRDKDPALMAYLIGFGCHYILDSTCHPYVNQAAGKEHISHTMLEKEFDRMLMLETGKNPMQFYPSDCIVPRYTYAKTIHKVMPQVRTKNIFASLKMMKIFTNLLVCNDGGRKRRRIEKILSVFGRGPQAFVSDFFMTPEPEVSCREELFMLDTLMEEALDKAPDMLAELAALAVHPGHLSESWNHTYNG